MNAIMLAHIQRTPLGLARTPSESRRRYGLRCSAWKVGSSSLIAVTSLPSAQQADVSDAQLLTVKQPELPSVM